jgi:hypothetical protein
LSIGGEQQLLARDVREHVHRRERAES